MERMKADDDSMHADMAWKEMGVGAIEINAMAYNSGLVPDEDKVLFCRQIVIHDDSDYHPGRGWGKIIFEGTLKDLIDKLNK